jgi:hypothetical protein
MKCLDASEAEAHNGSDGNENRSTYSMGGDGIQPNRNAQHASSGDKDPDCAKLASSHHRQLSRDVQRINAAASVSRPIRPNSN